MATQGFERAVNDITQALDGASQTMDGCAQIMTQTANYNLIQADATANASEEATTNVSNVAMAAEESCSIGREDFQPGARLRR